MKKKYLKFLGPLAVILLAAAVSACVGSHCVFGERFANPYNPMVDGDKYLDYAKRLGDISSLLVVAAFLWFHELTEKKQPA